MTDRRDLYDRAQFLRDHGRVPGDIQFFNSEVRYKYRMSSMQAALGLAQLERIEELVQRKREIFAMYREAFGDIAGITSECGAGRNEEQLLDHHGGMGPARSGRARTKSGIGYARWRGRC